MSRATYAAQLLANLIECGEVRQPGCVLKVEGDRYVMTKTRGELSQHSLDVSSTDPERLLAHWEGYTGLQLLEDVQPPQMSKVGKLPAGAFDWWDNPNPRRGW